MNLWKKYMLVIYLSIFQERVRKVLKEWNRVLIDGGILKLSVPSFLAVVEEYRANIISKALKASYVEVKSRTLITISIYLTKNT